MTFGGAFLFAFLLALTLWFLAVVVPALVAGGA